MSNSTSGIAAIETVCPICAKIDFVQVNTKAFIRWQNGELIQVAMPELSPTQREQLITGTCSPCWDNLWAFLEDDED